MSESGKTAFIGIAPCDLPEPAGWSLVDRRIDGAGYRNDDADRRYTVIYSVAVEQDGETWAHVSVAHPSRLPSYEMLARVKRDFCGADALAVLPFVPESEHINQHEHCLHLFCCLTRRALPDFARGGRTI